jgi:hypothetical protein
MEAEFKKWKVKLPLPVLNCTEITCSDDKTIEAKIEKDGSFARMVLENKMDKNCRRLVMIARMEKTAAMGTLDSEYKIWLALVHPSLFTSTKLSEKKVCCGGYPSESRTK